MSWGNSQTVASANVECTKKHGLYAAGLSCNDRQITREDILNNTPVLSTPSLACTVCSRNSTGYRSCCTALIMLDGWEIKDDYPW